MAIIAAVGIDQGQALPIVLSPQIILRISANHPLSIQRP
jgi:hypothetical protein